MCRRLGPIAALATLAVAAPTPAAAHGIGARSDLPVPLPYVLVGAGAVLATVFMWLVLLQSEPRWQSVPDVRPVTGPEPIRWGERVGRTVAVAAVVVVALGAVVPAGDGVTLPQILVWVVWWLAIPFAVVVAGNLHRFVNPWWWVDRLHRPGRGRGWGVWPAVFALWVAVWVALVWPLVDPNVALGTTGVLGLGAIAFTGYLVGAARLGVPHAQADPFFVTVRAFSAIAPLGARDDRGGVRRWLGALSVLPAWRGLSAFWILTIGAVVYDGLSATPWWRDTFGDIRDAWWLGTAALVVVPTVLGALYGVAAWAGSRASTASPTAVARAFAHVLVPVAVAWFVSHYLTLVAFEGQLLWSSLADPFARAGGADVTAIVTWLSPTVVAWMQAVIVVGGHLLAVALAHDRALALAGPEGAPGLEFGLQVLLIVLALAALTLLAVA